MIEPTGYTALDLIGFTDKGGYDPDAYYVKNDIVTVGNTKWRCLIDDTHNITPTEGVNWTIYLESATSLAGMDDVDLNSPTDGDIVVYNGTSQKWENSDALSSKMSWADYAKTGAYNLCPILNTTQVINGVTWTVNSDGTVTANCSSNSHAKSIFWIWADSTLRLSFPYTIRVCGAPNGAASNTYHMGGAGIPGGELYTETNITANTNIGLALVVAENAVVDNIVFKPMITTDLNATYADFVPYAMTNRELSVFSEYTDTTTNIKFVKLGRVCTVSLESANAITVNADTSFCNVPAEYRPKIQVGFSDSSGGKRIIIFPNGNMTPANVAWTNQTVRGSTTYITAI